MIIAHILIIIAYLIGSIPTSVWVGKWFYNIDVREHGSGNAGATNTIRVLGAKAGIPVFLFDVLKGWTAVMLVHFSTFGHGSNAFINFSIILGIVAVVGHIFPVFAGFRGGKGVATLLGMAIGVSLIPAAIAFTVFVIALIITKIISVSSMTAGIAYPVTVVFILHIYTPSLVAFSIIAAILLIVTHRKNIKRLLKGEEPKAPFLIRKKSS